MRSSVSWEGRGGGSRWRSTGKAETVALESKRSGFEPWPCHLMALWPGKSRHLSEPQFLHLQNGASTQIAHIK